MRSMTGFGGKKHTEGGISVEVELKSWNHKGLDVQMKLPESFARLDASLRDLASKKAGRGKVFCTVRVRGNFSGEVILNDTLITGVVAPFRRLCEKNGLPASVSLSDLMDIPGAVEIVEGETEPVEALIRSTIENALEEWDRSRLVEGERLQIAIRDQVASLESAVAIIEKRNETAPAEQKARMKTRVAELIAEHAPTATGETGVDEKRLELELALLAEKSDVKEEIVRLHTHIRAARKLIDQAGAAARAVGAELGFILQELLRETNTVGSKTQDIETIGAVIAGKTAIDRIKELAANVV